MNLELPTFELYYKCVEAIEARESLIGIGVADFPQMKSNARSKRFEELKKLSIPKEVRPKGKILTTEQALGFLAMKGSGRG